MFNKNIAHKGSLMISEPFLTDPNFERSVILLCDHDEQGTLGFILNKKLGYPVGVLMKELQDVNLPIYYGGPVGQDELFFIHTRFDLMLSGERLHDGVYFGGDSERLFSLINEHKISEDEVKFFKGYSGWGANQLHRELTENTWAVQNRYHASLVFEKESELLWREVLISLGDKYAHVLNFPKSPHLN